MVMLHYDIPDDLHRQAKAAAAMQGLTLKDWLIAVLEAAVTDGSAAKRKR